MELLHSACGYIALLALGWLAGKRLRTVPWRISQIFVGSSAGASNVSPVDKLRVLTSVGSRASRLMGDAR